MVRQQRKSFPSFAPKRTLRTKKAEFMKSKLVYRALLLGVFIVMLCLIYIWSRVQVLQTGYQINNLKNEHHQIKTTHRHLQMELFHLKMPQRIEAIGKEKLDMGYPEITNIVNLKDLSD